MFNEQEYIEARDYALRMLPQILEQDPAFATTLKGIIVEHTPPSAHRDRLARMLDEIADGRRVPNRFRQRSQI